MRGLRVNRFVVVRSSEQKLKNTFNSNILFRLREHPWWSWPWQGVNTPNVKGRQMINWTRILHVVPPSRDFQLENNKLVSRGTLADDEQLSRASCPYKANCLVGDVSWIPSAKWHQYNYKNICQGDCKDHLHDWLLSCCRIVKDIIRRIVRPTPRFCLYKLFDIKPSN